MEKVGPWKVLEKEEKYSNPWIEVVEHQIINPGGGEGIYGKVHFKNIAVGVIPIDEDGNTWLVGQHRFTLDEYSWEIPEGGAPEAESIEEAARRELKEETGLEARTLELFMKLHTSNSVTDEVAYIFLAKGLIQGSAQLEESESDLKVKKVSIAKAVEMVMNGEITDSMSVAGILKADRILN